MATALGSLGPDPGQRGVRRNVVLGRDRGRRGRQEWRASLSRASASRTSALRLRPSASPRRSMSPPRRSRTDLHKSTVWRPLTPDDKLVVYGIDDPVVEGVACHYTVPEQGGIKGTLGVAEEVSDISLACRQVGPVVQGKVRAGRRRLQRAPVADLQAHADRARLRREAQQLVYWSIRTLDRGLAQELDLERADHAVGREANRPRCADG